MSDNLKAYLVGTALVFVLAPFTGQDVSERLVVFIYTAAFGIAGGVVGYLWPRKGWRLGLPLVAFWLLMSLGSILFGLGEASWDTARELKGLLEQAAIVVAACFGAEVGAIIGRRQGRRAAAAKD